MNSFGESVIALTSEEVNRIKGVLAGGDGAQALDILKDVLLRKIEHGRRTRLVKSSDLGR